MYDCNSSDNLAVGYALGRDANNNNNGNGFGWGNDWWAIIILFALVGWGNGGWGGFGGFNGNGGNVPYIVGNTDAALQRGFDTQTIIGKLDGISNGICSLGYDQLAQMNNLGLAIANGFHGVDNAVCSLGYQTAQLANDVNNNITQSRFANQQCCCETNRNIDAVRYENARNTCDIITAGQANTQRIIDFMTQEKLDSLRDQLQTANFQLSQQAQNAYLVDQLRPCPIPAYLSCSPYTSYNPATLFGNNGFYGYNGYNNNGCGCGCNTGCCGCNN